jgi:type IV pilus assembly protein PilA
VVLESIRKSRGRRGGFTLIELLVVVLILAILMAVAMPLYLNAVTESERRTCRANMQTISNANQAHKVRLRSYVIGSDLSALNPDLGATPKCPINGTYSTEAVGTGFKVVSTGCGHGEFTPGVDAQ